MGGQVNFCKLNSYSMYLHYHLGDANISGYFRFVFWSSFPISNSSHPPQNKSR